MTELTIHDVRDVEEYQRLRPEMLELFSRSGVPWSAVAHPDWVAHWWQSRPPTSTIRCCLIRVDGRLVANFPIEFGKRLPLRLHKGASTNIYWGWSSSLVDPGTTTDWTPALTDWLGSGTPRWFAVELGLFPPDSPAWQRLPDAFPEWHTTDVTREIAALRLPATFDAYLAGSSKNLRRKYGRVRRLAEQTGLRSRWYRPAGDDLERVIGTVSTRSWQGRSGVAVYSDPANRTFYRLLADHPGELDLVLHEVDSPDALPLAYVLATHVGDVVHHIDTGFDADAAHLSPGLLATFDAFQWACEQGLVRLDLGVNADYKSRFGPTVTSARGIVITRGLAGRVARSRSQSQSRTLQA